MGRRRIIKYHYHYQRQPIAVCRGNCAFSTSSNTSANCRYFNKKFGKQSAIFGERAIEIIAAKQAAGQLQVALDQAQRDELKQNAQAIRLAPARDRSKRLNGFKSVKTKQVR